MIDKYESYLVFECICFFSFLFSYSTFILCHVAGGRGKRKGITPAAASTAIDTTAAAAAATTTTTTVAGAISKPTAANATVITAAAAPPPTGISKRVAAVANAENSTLCELPTYSMTVLIGNLKKEREDCMLCSSCASKDNFDEYCSECKGVICCSACLTPFQEEDDWVECGNSDKCGRWYHEQCIIRNNDASQSRRVKHPPFKCPFCTYCFATECVQITRLLDGGASKCPQAECQRRCHRECCLKDRISCDVCQQRPDVILRPVKKGKGGK